MPIDKNYLETIKNRSKKGHIYKGYQMTGLMLADVLRDREHKTLYITLAKNYDERELMILAKNIAEKRTVRNMGAYFMRLVQSLPKNAKKPPIAKKPKKKKQKSLFKWKK